MVSSAFWTLIRMIDDAFATTEPEISDANREPQCCAQRLLCLNKEAHPWTLESILTSIPEYVCSGEHSLKALDSSIHLSVSYFQSCSRYIYYAHVFSYAMWCAY